MKLKTILISIAVILNINCSGQSFETIKDYFIPVASKNQATFYQLDQDGRKTDFQRTIYYVNVNGNYDVMASTYYKPGKTTLQTMTVSITQDEVRMINSVSITSGENGTTKEKNYNPPSIILKMPPLGQIENWDFIDISGENKNCTSSWTNVIFEGERRHAIKVVMVSKGIVASQISYYVKGVGLWEIQFQDAKGEIFTFCELYKLDYFSGEEK